MGNGLATSPGHPQRMDRNLISAVVGGDTCEVCGRLPHPRRIRLTLVKLLAVFPVELALHALVVRYHLSYAVTVAVLTLTTTVLVIWVVEPSAMRLLRAWLHAPALTLRRRVDAAPALWRIRVRVDDQPGALEQLTRRLAELDVNILGMHIHPLEDGALDEIVVVAPDEIRSAAVAAAVESAGGRDVHVWPTSALALVDGQTTALSFAARVAADPAELPLAISELLRARVVTDCLTAQSRRPDARTEESTTLRVPSPWTGLFVFTRPGEPFTPAERARASRLAEVAEAAAAPAVIFREPPSSQVCDLSVSMAEAARVRAPR